MHSSLKKSLKIFLLQKVKTSQLRSHSFQVIILDRETYSKSQSISQLCESFSYFEALVIGEVGCFSDRNSYQNYKKNSNAIYFKATGISWRILTKSPLLWNINFSNWQEQMTPKLFSKFRSKSRLQKQPVLPNFFCFDFKIFHNYDQNMESFSTKKK